MHGKLRSFWFLDDLRGPELSQASPTTTKTSSSKYTKWNCFLLESSEPSIALSIGIRRQARLGIGALPKYQSPRKLKWHACRPLLDRQWFRL